MIISRRWSGGCWFRSANDPVSNPLLPLIGSYLDWQCISANHGGEELLSTFEGSRPGPASVDAACCFLDKVCWQGAIPATPSLHCDQLLLLFARHTVPHQYRGIHVSSVAVWILAATTLLTVWRTCSFSKTCSMTRLRLYLEELRLQSRLPLPYFNILQWQVARGSSPSREITPTI